MLKRLRYYTINDSMAAREKNLAKSGKIVHWTLVQWDEEVYRAEHALSLARDVEPNLRPSHSAGVPKALVGNRSEPSPEQFRSRSPATWALRIDRENQRQGFHRARQGKPKRKAARCPG